MFFQNDAILVQLADLAKQSDYLICTPRFGVPDLTPHKTSLGVIIPTKLVLHFISARLALSLCCAKNRNFLIDCLFILKK